MTTEKTSSLNLKRIILLILFGLILLAILWVGFKSWRIYQVGQAMLARKTEVEGLMADGIINIDPDKAESLVMDTRQDIKALKAETAVFMPLTPYLGWIPKVGSTLVHAESFMTMADSGIDGAAYAVRGLKPALSVLQGDTTSDASMFSQLSNTLIAAAPDLAAANEELEKVAAARAHITNVEDMPWQIQTLISLSDEWLPFAQEGLALTAVFPEILGVNGARTYLIIAQNEDELRPTGGFISGAGTMVVEDGEISSLNMIDAYRVDAWYAKPYDFPPQPLYDYMGIDLFLFRDSNYWPDFPTSANKLMDLYSYGQDQPPADGVIAIDQEFIRLITEATGPIYIQDSDLTITPENTIETLHSAWATRESDDQQEWLNNRKAFIGVFTAAIFDHIQNNFSAIDPVILMTNIKSALKEKHLQIYIRDEKSANILNEINWNGGLNNPIIQDYIAVVDTNMGFNKVNLHVKRDLNYMVSLNNEGTGEANLTITHSHTGQGAIPKCNQYNLEAYEVGGQYLDMAENCYWNYLRVYVPEGSELIAGTEHQIPGNVMRQGNSVNSTPGVINEQQGLTTWDNFFLVPYGQSISNQYHYLLPQVATTVEDNVNQYQLTVRKQAGTELDSATISINLPAGSEFISAKPTPKEIDGETLIFEIILDTDKIITVTYQ